MDFSHSTAIMFLLIVALLCASPHQVNCQQQQQQQQQRQQNDAVLTISTHDVVIVMSEMHKFVIQLNGHYDKNVNVTFEASQSGVVDMIPTSFEFKPNDGITKVEGTILGRSPGHVEIAAKSRPPNVIDTSDVYIRVVVAYSLELINISSVIGWCYFVAWSISFYPQIYSNFQRKSVVGLNFDFISLNVVGFVLYAIFNVGLYYIPEIQDEYSERFPRSLNPVQLNDVFFSCHAMFATFITICQCFAYDRADQRVSVVARSILTVFAVVGILAVVLSLAKVIIWLDFLYICSYIKLSITLVKYVPQAYMNYRRKSTLGWSIGNVLLDFTGGMLSMLQMILNAYNHDDWASIFGDPTKFGLGLFSVMFDILFLLQHYLFYRDREPYTEIEGDNNETPIMAPAPAPETSAVPETVSEDDVVT